MFRVHKRLARLKDAFAQVTLEHYVFTAMLVSVTDGWEPGVFETDPQGGEYYQVMAGVAFNGSEQQLLHDVLVVVRRAVDESPCVPADKARLLVAFDKIAPTIIAES